MITSKCQDGAKIKIKFGNDLLFENCYVDAFSINNFDSLDINSDGVIDFLFTLQSDDYCTLVALISQNDTMSYKSYDLIDIMSAELYSTQKIVESDVIKEYIIVKSSSGKLNIMTNVLLRNGEIIPLTGFSDTLLISEIMKTTR